MWDVGNKTFAVESVRMNRTAVDRINRPSLAPPMVEDTPPPPPVPPKKKRGTLKKTIAAAVLLASPNPVRDSIKTQDTVRPAYGVTWNQQTPPGPRPTISVAPDAPQEKAPEPIPIPIPDWNELFDNLTPAPEPKPEVVSESQVVGEPITVREIYITPPLLSRSAFDTVGN